VCITKIQATVHYGKHWYQSLVGVKNGKVEMPPKKKPARKPINASTKRTLQAKAKKSGISYGTLATVYRRGQGAYLSSGSKSASMAAWAMGRVNSYVRGSRKHDTDLRKKRAKKK